MKKYDRRMECSQNVFGILHPVLREAIRRAGYVKPTIVQCYAIPVVLKRLHTLIIAPTGSGKTEAALFPVMSMLLEKPVAGLRAIYITPLRSLNRDIFERMSYLAARIGLDMRVRHGDTSEAAKKAFLQNPPNIMVTTPETLYFLLSVNKFREILGSLTFIIVDEIHEMIDSKRGSELAIALERIEEYAGRKLQRIGLSATLKRPELAARMLAGHRLVEIVDVSWLAKDMDIIVTAPGPKATTRDIAEKLGVDEETSARLAEIADLIKKAKGGVLIFTNTRDSAEIIGALLRRILGDNTVLVHHGSLSREERLKAEKLFKTGEIRAVVATSSLELGIDIGHADLVIQYMSPRQSRRLIQRIGRSRHRLGEKSRGIIIATRNFYDILESAVIAARALRGNLEAERPYINAYDALTHQIAGMIIEAGRLNLEKVFWVIKRAYPYAELSWDELLAIASFMDMAKIAKIEGVILRRGKRLYSYYYEVTMIPDTRQYPVYDTISGEKIGVLDEEFVATLSENDIFVLGGRLWEVVTVDDNAVRVKPASASQLIPPAWEGELIPVEWEVAREAGSILRRYEAIGCKVLEYYPLDERARQVITNTLKKHVSQGLPLPTDKRMVVESLGDTIIVHVFLGSRGAKALELALSYYSKEIMGYTPWSTSMPYAVILRYTSRMPAKRITEMLKMLAELSWSEVERMVLEASAATRIYEWKLYHVALRMGALEKGAKPDKRMLRKLIDTIAGKEALREFVHDKLDLKVLKKLLEDIKTGRVRTEAIDLEKPSPLAEHVLSEARIGDRVLAEAIPATVLAEVVKRRLASKTVRLVCLLCGTVWEAKVSDLPERPRCPHCGSGFIAPTRLEPREAKSLVAKMRRRARLSSQEKKLANEHKEAADIVLTYGRKGIEALSAIGVGPLTARQVLRKLIFGEEAFYKALVEAEQKYLRTRKYWD